MKKSREQQRHTKGNANQRTSQVSKQQSAKPTHAYLFLYTPRGVGRVEILMGRESVINSQAILDWKKKFADSALKDQFQKLFDGIQGRKQILGANDGALLPRSSKDLSKKNMGGLLLIGRSALPGGRIERGETSKRAAVRELVEEYELHGLTSDTKRLVEQNLDKVAEISSENGRRIEVYYALNLDQVERVQPTILSAESILRHFSSKVEPQLVDIWNERRSAKKGAEKRGAYTVNLEALKDNFRLTEEDRQYIRARVHEFSKVFCDELSRVVEKKLSPEDVEFFANEIVQYTFRRTMTMTDEAIDKFICSRGNPRAAERGGIPAAATPVETHQYPSSTARQPTEQSSVGGGPSLKKS